MTELGEEDKLIFSDPLLSEWKQSMIESNRCVHDIEHYSEDGYMWLVCKKCEKSWVV